MMNHILSLKSVLWLLLIIILGFSFISSVYACGPIIHPFYRVLLQNQTDQVLNVYQSGYLIGKVEPGKIIIAGWDTHSAYIEIEAKNLAGEIVFSDTYSSGNLKKIEVYQGVIPPLTINPTSSNLSQNK
jgi:hypothetical protein